MSKATPLLRQRELLRKEYEAEKAAFEKSAELMGVGRNVKRGDCWFPICWAQLL